MKRDPWVFVAAAASLLLLLNLAAVLLLWWEPSAPPFEEPEVWRGQEQAEGTVAAVEDAAAGIQRDHDLGWEALDLILEQRVRRACDGQGLDAERALPDPALRDAVVNSGAPSPEDRQAWLTAWQEAYRQAGLAPALLAGIVTSSPESAAAP